MCGRFRIDITPGLLEARYGADSGLTATSFNVAPTQAVPVIRAEGNRRLAELMRFGFLPFYAKTLGEGAKSINARIETVTEKPAFSRAIQQHRCVIPAEGFYEWANGTKQPWHFQPEDGEGLSFGGIFSRRMFDGKEVASFAILTTPPHPVVARVHDRTPLMLGPDMLDRWLDPLPLSAADLGQAVASCHAVRLAAWTIGKAVGNPRNNDASLIVPVHARSQASAPVEARQD